MVQFRFELKYTYSKWMSGSISINESLLNCDVPWIGLNTDWLIVEY